MANTVDKVLKIAEAEVGYLEKKTNADLDSKTKNAGYNNYTKYGRKIGNWWEDMSEDYIDRGSIKQRVRKEIEKEIG